MLELESYVTALPGRVFYNGGNPIGLFESQIDRLGDTGLTLVGRNFFQVTAGVEIQ